VHDDRSARVLWLVSYEGEDHTDFYSLCIPARMDRWMPGLVLSWRVVSILENVACPC
jgi:hypothetical protein